MTLICNAVPPYSLAITIPQLKLSSRGWTTTGQQTTYPYYQLSPVMAEIIARGCHLSRDTDGNSPQWEQLMQAAFMSEQYRGAPTMDSFAGSIC